MSDNQEVYVAKLHWVLFLGPLILIILAMLLGIYIAQLKEVALLLIVFALCWIGISWITYRFSSLTIKKKQIIFRTGLLVRKTTDISLGKIESVDIQQSILGSILRYGALEITGTGGTKHMVNFLAKPLTCRRYIEQLMHG